MPAPGHIDPAAVFEEAWEDEGRTAIALFLGAAENHTPGAPSGRPSPRTVWPCYLVWRREDSAAAESVHRCAHPRVGDFGIGG